MNEFPPFLLDAANQLLLRWAGTGDDERVRLTPKASSVLRYLVERAGRLVTQDEVGREDDVLQVLWGDDQRVFCRARGLGADGKNDAVTRAQL
jgi:DNA-binding winged helix-turn-helix (wHTH) protein